MWLTALSIHDGKVVVYGEALKHADVPVLVHRLGTAVILASGSRRGAVTARRCMAPVEVTMAPGRRLYETTAASSDPVLS